MKDLPDEQQSKLEKASFPEWLDPMLATLTDDYFDDENWIFERKLDGIRVLVFSNGKDVSLKSRNGNELNDTYPELVDVLKEESDEPFIADGEIVAFDENVTSFSKLQNRMNISDPEEARNSNVKVYLYLFDLMYFSNYDLTELELRTRKQILKEALTFNNPVRYTSHRNKEGISFHEEACEKQWEGIIAKDGRSGYVQSRSKKWLKFKCTARQELVIGGYTDPQGERIGFGALLLGYYENGDFLYAGQVGTGFDDELLENLHSKLSNIERKTNPFESDDMEAEDVHFVTPKYIAEIEFTEWTNDNKLRHPRFLGLRKDKEPEDVHQEKA
ncbi:MAG: non-homologous end-joining DNA ligase [Balneolaceae bacterium]|nr:non-homologous end-joining DNA ligase [Balneolaceae bacterium]